MSPIHTTTKKLNVFIRHVSLWYFYHVNLWCVSHKFDPFLDVAEYFSCASLAHNGLNSQVAPSDECG
jgi:hypothetical protein